MESNLLAWQVPNVVHPLALKMSKYTLLLVAQKYLAEVRVMDIPASNVEERHCELTIGLL